MAQYIDKDALVAKIENLLKPVKQRLERDKNNPWDSDIAVYKFGKQLMKNIDTLEDDRVLGGIWKPADGDDLPEYDREVIAITDYIFGHYMVVYAHRPNPNGWNGTNIDTEEKEHFEPVLYDKGGWNQPHVLYWLDARLPYEENKIDKEIDL